MLDHLISLVILEDLAGTTAFRRGEEYFSVGAVGRLRVTDDKITAKVEGTETYQVELRDDDDDLAYDCTCPRARDGSEFHQAAGWRCSEHHELILVCTACNCSRKRIAVDWTD